MNELDLFGETLVYKNEYKLSWCNLCDCASFKCPKCGNGSCSGGGCDYCHKDYEEFSQKKFRIGHYLSEPELITLRRIQKFQKIIPICLAAGFPEVNWEYLHKQGEFAPIDYTKYFKEELKGFNAKDFLNHEI